MTTRWPLEQPSLADQQVVLRAWTPADAPQVFSACQDPAIQHFTQVPVPYLKEHAEYFVAEGPLKWAQQEAAPFAVVDRATHRLVGACGLVEVDLKAGQGGAGYWVAPAARSRGVARRALSLLTEWSLAEGGLRRVYLEIEEANPASSAVAAAVGFRRVGQPVSSYLKGSERHFTTWEKLTTSSRI
jgi:RimJ/RimL family protein N-acetyltransferase